MRFHEVTLVFLGIAKENTVVASFQVITNKRACAKTFSEHIIFAANM